MLGLDVLKVKIIFSLTVFLILFTVSCNLISAQSISPFLASDINNDGKIDGVDYVLLLNKKSDLGIWINNYGGKPAITTNGYYVLNNKIYDAAGKIHIFRGVDKPSLEWSSSGDHVAQADFQIIKDWKANIVRVALNQVYWRQNTNNYQNTIKTVVTAIENTGMDVILDLHWSDQGSDTVAAAQQKMADKNSLTFWSQVANIYKNDGRVMFELYNEPHDVSCDVWQNGGSVDGWQVAGMQEMYNTVRQQGAQNIVLVGGLNWAFDLTCVKTNRIVGYNIAYATHPYNFAGKNTPTDWENKVGFLSATDPIVATEFGSTLDNSPAGSECDSTFDQSFLTWAESKGINWTAWAWFPGGCNFPPIIKDWSGTANANGHVVQSYLQKN